MCCPTSDPVAALHTSSTEFWIARQLSRAGPVPAPPRCVRRLPPRPPRIFHTPPHPALHLLHPQYGPHPHPRFSEHLHLGQHRLQGAPRPNRIGGFRVRLRRRVRRFFLPPTTDLRVCCCLARTVSNDPRLFRYWRSADAGATGSMSVDRPPPRLAPRPPTRWRVLRLPLLLLRERRIPDLLLMDRFLYIRCLGPRK